MDVTNLSERDAPAIRIVDENVMRLDVTQRLLMLVLKIIADGAKTGAGCQRLVRQYFCVDFLNAVFLQSIQKRLQVMEILPLNDHMLAKAVYDQARYVEKGQKTIGLEC